MKRLGEAIGKVVRRLSWRDRIKRDFHRDPLTCPRCVSNEMVLFSLTLRWKGRLLTIGGIDWLLARGDIVELQPSPSPMPGSILQLALPL